MARALRVEFPGAWHHVMNRGARRQVTFLDDDDRLDFLRLLGVVSQRYGVEVNAYCLMGTHYHVLIHTPDPRLSDAMRHLNSVFTQRFNRRHGFDGPLFKGRFHSVLVDSEEYLGRVVAYIHRNPMEAKLVLQPDEYPWSSFADFSGARRPPAWLSARWQRISGIRTRSDLFDVTLRSDIELAAFYNRSMAPPILGRERFVKKWLDATPHDQETNGHRARAIDRPTPLEIDAAVCAVLQVERRDIHEPRPGSRCDGRTMAVGLSQRWTSLTQPTLAEHYGYSSAKGVASATARFEHRVATESDFAWLRARVSEKLGVRET